MRKTKVLLSYFMYAGDFMFSILVDRYKQKRGKSPWKIVPGSPICVTVP